MTADQLKFIVPGIKASNLAVYVPLLNKYMDKYVINTKNRMAGFLANLAVESGSFNYTLEIASGAAYDTGDLAIMLGNTPDADGDGQKYKGRGLIQATGRTMYKAVSMALYGDLRLLQTPELLEQPDPATESACWIWAVSKKLNDIADKPDDWTNTRKGKTYTKFQWEVYRINGGQRDIEKREQYYARALQIL